MAGRVIALGDIHGCSAALHALVAAIDPQPEDCIISLGDVVDRGIDSRGVIELLIELQARCRLIVVQGNHEEALLKARTSKGAFREWLEFGGLVTLDSYGDTGRMSLIPQSHIRFLAACRPFYDTDTHFFTHANYDPNLPLDRQDGRVLRWLSLHDHLPPPHRSGKVAVLGHTPQPEVLNVGGYLLGLDTGCCDGGWLTAMDVTSGDLWQADERGWMRGRAAATEA